MQVYTRGSKEHEPWWWQALSKHGCTGACQNPAGRSIVPWELYAAISVASVLCQKPLVTVSLPRNTQLMWPALSSMATTYLPEGDAADNTVLKAELLGFCWWFFVVVHLKCWHRGTECLL